MKISYFYDDEHTDQRTMEGVGKMEFATEPVDNFATVFDMVGNQICCFEMRNLVSVEEG